MTKNKKIFLILIVLFLGFLIFSNRSLAYTDLQNTCIQDSLTRIDTSKVCETPVFVITNGDSTYIGLFYYVNGYTELNNVFLATDISNGSVTTTLTNPDTSQTCGAYTYVFCYNGTSYVGNSPQTYMRAVYNSLSDDSSIIYANLDIYVGSDSNRTLFFQKTPVQTSPTLQQVLAEGYKTAQTTTTEAITSQLATLVPVGIVILATMITVSLVAYFRFWKA